MEKTKHSLFFELLIGFLYFGFLAGAWPLILWATLN